MNTEIVTFQSVRRARVALLSLFLLVGIAAASAASDVRIEVSIKKGLVSEAQSGRVFVVLASAAEPEPRSLIGKTEMDMPPVIARDVTNLAPGAVFTLDDSAFVFPAAGLAELRPGRYFAQAVLDSNRDLRSPDSPGNLYGQPVAVRVEAGKATMIKLELTRQIPPEELPNETDLVKYIKIKSRLLSEFHGRPIYLRAGIILPRGYEQEKQRRYPLWVRIGGWATRYSSVAANMNPMSGFRRTWMADETPRIIVLQVDGAGPYGDPYQVNSANNGPYGDALTQELIPAVEARFRAIGQPHARVLSGVSTGGWVALALQVFYPDFFNGTWVCAPDGVDFRAFELVNIYQDTNAYVNQYGFERPSERAVTGEVKLTMRREVGAENLLGFGDSWTTSGGQWCAWNAVYGPRGADGLPVPLWDPKTGVINHKVAEQWKKYDLRLVMESNWKTLGPKLRGKLRLAVGDADDYFLNNAVHLLDDFLSKANPPYEGRISYGPGMGHGWTDTPLPKMLKEMEAATGPIRTSGPLR